MERRQLVLFGAILAAITAVLAIAYLAFLRPDFAVLYEDIREADAAEIVGQLDKEGIEYRLEDEGRRILVPKGELGRARVLVAGSGIAMGGVVGFELFNETDMGLTEFAQKVNYQRALQGELARTIMTMDGIGFARVHLSLPERSLFRAAQQGPKAAVTLQTEQGRALSPERVEGIQQLVAAAVPELPAYRVAVLDHRGRLLSAPPRGADEPAGPLTEREALEEYYRARASGAAERLIPGLPFQVRVLALGLGEAREPAESADAPHDAPAAAPAPAEAGAAGRNFRLRIALRTEAELGAEDRELLRAGIAEAVGLEPGRGDMLRFETGPLDAPAPAGGMAPTRADADHPAYVPPHPSSTFGGQTAGDILSSGWLWAAFAVLAGLAVILLRRRSRMSGEEQQSFADLLGESLALREGAADGR